MAAAVLLALGTGVAGAQSPALLTRPDGVVVEVIGLRRWTIDMVQDSLARYAAGVTLDSHACAAALRYKLGFADAAATRMMERGVLKRVVVVVVEPHDSARVRYRTPGADTVVTRPHWQAATAVMKQQPRVFQRVVTIYTAAPGEVATSYGEGSDSAQVAEAVAFLRERVSEQDRLEAHDVLWRGSNHHERAIAALILANFPHRDDTYRMLVEAMRETDGPVKGVAARVLEAVSSRSRRVVDWAPASEAIHAMLDGTSLVTLPALMDVLVTTGVDSTMARPLLQDGATTLLAYVGSSTPSHAQRARALLARLHGSDLGPSVDAWRMWVSGLSDAPPHRR